MALGYGVRFVQGGRLRKKRKLHGLLSAKSLYLVFGFSMLVQSVERTFCLQQGSGNHGMW